MIRLLALLFVALLATPMAQQPQPDPNYWRVLVSETEKELVGVDRLYIQETFDGGYAGLITLPDGTQLAISGYPVDVTPEPAPVDDTLPPYWPTVQEPYRGWGSKERPRGVSPVNPATGPHPVGWASYVDYLVANPTEIEQWVNWTRAGNANGGQFVPWEPTGSTASGGQHPQRALGCAIVLALHERGFTDIPLPEVIELVESYMLIFDPELETEADRFHISNWPSGGPGEGSFTCHTLALLLGHFEGRVRPEAWENAQRHAKWLCHENWEWRQYWAVDSKANVPAFHWYWDSHMMRLTLQAGIGWLLGEGYEPQDAEWVHLAERFGETLYHDYLPHMRARSLGWPFESDLPGDVAGMGLAGYRWAERHFSLLVGLHMLTGVDHMKPEQGTSGFGEAAQAGGFYEILPSVWRPSFGNQTLLSLAPHCEPQRQTLASIQPGGKHYAAWTRDPVVASLYRQQAPLFMPGPTQPAYRWSNRLVPWWYFSDPNVPSVSWQEEMPHRARMRGEGLTICREPWEMGEDAALVAFRDGNVFWHHYRPRLGLFWFHRGWLLPPTYVYHTWRSQSDDLPACYTGVHIFDPEDQSNLGGLGWQSGPIGVPFVRDGGPKRVGEPYIYDLGQTYHSTAPVAQAGEWKFSYMEQIRQRLEPEVNSEREQSRQRFVGAGEHWHAASLDHSPMFRTWPEDRYYGPYDLKLWDGGSGWTNVRGVRYEVMSRTDRVNPTNGYVRSYAWIDEDGKEPVMVVIDSVALANADHAVENHWWAVNDPIPMGGNVWKFEDHREVRNCSFSVTWGPSYSTPTGYQYAGALYLQLFYAGSPVAPDAVTVLGGEGMENVVVEDGVLSGNDPISFQAYGNSQCRDVQVPAWDPRFGPAEEGRYVLVHHPAKGTDWHSFVTVLNSEVNGSGRGPVSCTVHESGQGDVTVTVDGWTVALDRETWAVTVSQ